MGLFPKLILSADERRYFSDVADGIDYVAMGGKACELGRNIIYRCDELK